MVDDTLGSDLAGDRGYLAPPRRGLFSCPDTGRISGKRLCVPRGWWEPLRLAPARWPDSGGSGSRAGQWRRIFFGL